MQMKQLVRTVPAAFVFTLLLGTSTSSADALDLAIATKVVDELEVSWNAGDGSAYAAQFWPEAELVNIFGAAIEGQASIEERLSEILQGAFRGSQMTSEVRRVR